MRWSKDVEYRIAVESRLDRIEEMLSLALFGLEPGETDVQNYTIERVGSVGCENVSTSDMCSLKEREMLVRYAEKHKPLALVYASAIGFANGVEWARENI